MEKKKLTRDEHLIKLVRENEDKTARIKELEEAEKGFDKRLKKVEKELLRLFALIKTQDRKATGLREQTSALIHEVQGVQQTLSRRKQT